MTEIKKITYNDFYKISDVVKFNNDLIVKKRNNSPFIGLVRLIKNQEIVSKEESINKDGWLTNMTIGIGREFANQKLFNKFNAGSTIGDLTGFKIDAFGIGSGGSSINQQYNVTLLGPTLCDPSPGLYSPIALNSACLTINGHSNVVKFIESAGPGGTVGTIEQEISSSPEYSSCQGLYTITKCSCVIDNMEPSFLNAGEHVKIDEAVLYATSSTNSNPIPFAHICFAPKFIEKETVFIIEWYIIF